MEMFYIVMMFFGLIGYVIYLKLELNRLETMIVHNEKQFNNLRHEFYIHKHD
ncbi:hypothetical protein [Bacillus cereus]|uniref:hypothetical protein n=1 Tax=Bacillus cereus TaxID=1396 RepID=UPI0015D50437|nr:hypothetical protein [Bacillus cereus]